MEVTLMQDWITQMIIDCYSVTEEEALSLLLTENHFEFGIYPDYVVIV